MALSNGSSAAIQQLLEQASLVQHFVDLLSVEDVHTFKPDAAVYRHFLNKAGCQPQSAWLISANSFDVIGAVSAGLQSVWLQREKSAIFDPWEVEPTVTITSLSELPATLKEITERQLGTGVRNNIDNRQQQR